MSGKYPGVFRPTFTDHKTGETRVCSTYFIRYSHKGKTVREKTGTTDPKLASKIRAQRIAEIHEGRFVGPQAGGITIEHLRDMVMANYAATGKRTDPKGLVRRFRRLAQHLGHLKAINVSSSDLDAYVSTRLGEGAALGSIDFELANLQRGYALAVKAKKIPHLAVPDFPALEYDNARRVVAERDDVEAIAKHMPHDLQAIPLVALYTGWRHTAVQNIPRHAVDLANGFMTLQREHSKNKKRYTVPLIPELRVIAEEQDRRAQEIERRTGRMVTTFFFYWGREGHRVPILDGSPVKTFDARFRQAREKAGLPHIRFHDLKRGAILWLRRAGLTEHEIMSWVGLETPEVFRRYDVIDEERTRETGERAARYLEQAGPGKVAAFKR